MTENEWLNAIKPYSCKEIAKDFGTARKLRLLMVGYLGPLQELFSPGARNVFLMLREWAEDECKRIEDKPWSAPGGPLGDNMEWSLRGIASSAVGWVVHHGSRIEPNWTYSIAMPGAELTDKVAQALVLKRVGNAPKGVSVTHPSHRAWSQAWQNELQADQAKQADLMRCVYGNPFRPASCEPTWITPTVLSLAQSIYTDRTFDQLPTLADELEKTGCANQEILGHCRGPGPHVRGCWVVDLMLGKG